MRQTLKILRGVFVTMVALVGVALVLLHIPPVQKQITHFVEKELEDVLGTEILIDHITIGFPNRLIVGGLVVDDHMGKRLFEVSRLAAKFDWGPLFREGRISLHTAQIFGLHAYLNRQTPHSTPNYQFVIDSLSSSDATSTSLPIDLRINSVLIRRARLSYDVYSEPYIPGAFDPNHVGISDFNATLSLKALSKDSINATVKRLDMIEQSGLALKSLQLNLLANSERMVLNDFDLQFPASRLKFDSIVADYPCTDKENGTLLERLYVKGSIHPHSCVTLKDFTPFASVLSEFNTPLWLGGSIQHQPGTTSVESLKVCSQNGDIDMLLSQMQLIFKKKSPYLNTALQIDVNNRGLELLCQNLGSIPPPQLLRLGFLRFDGKMNGPFDNLQAKGILESAVGNLDTEVAVNVLPEGKITYKGNIATEDSLDLMTILGPEKKLGYSSFALHFRGTHIPGKSPEVYLQGALPTLQYSGYEYQNIRMDGIIGMGRFDGLLALDDENVSFNANGRVDFNGKVPVFNLTAHLNHFLPYNLHLTDSRQGHEYGMKMKARFSGNHIDNIDGQLLIDSLTVIAPNECYFMDSLCIRAEKLNGRRKQLAVKGDFVDVVLDGEFAYTLLPVSFKRIVGKYFPSLIPENGTVSYSRNNFTFSLHLADSDFYPLVLGIPLSLSPDLTLQGYVDDKNGLMKINGYSPMIVYGKNHFESLTLNCMNNQNFILAEARATKYQEEDSNMSMVVYLQGSCDNLNARFSWGNDAVSTYAGKLETNVTFSRANKRSPHLQADIRLVPSQIILNDTVWQVQETSILVDSGYIDIRDLLVENNEQFLRVNGRLATAPTDSLEVELNNVNVKYILDLVNFHAVEFTGEATGKAYVIGALGKEMQANTKLQINNFHFNRGLMGNMDIIGRWDEEKGVVLDADIREGDLARTIVCGNISPKEKGLDLQIGAENTRLDFLNSFVGGVFENISGRVRGDIRLHGPFKALNLEGDAVADAVAKAKILNTAFTLLNDSVHLRKEYIEFPNAVIYDTEGHQGVVSGRLLHTHLGDMRYSFMINTDNLLVYDTKDFGNMPFYGSIYGTGNARLWGGGNELHLNVNMRTDRNSQFVYNMSTPEAITDGHFITFIDKTPRPEAATPDYTLPLFNRYNAKEKEREGTPLEVFIDAAIDATSDATIKVLMDAQSGDHVLARGNGTIHINYTNEACNLRGAYIIDNGTYKMSVQEVIRKDFLLQQGSEVNFTGNGGDADLNVKAVYTVNSASLSDLMPDASFNQNTVKVNCIINMTGKLANPMLNFDLELPTVNAEEQALVRSAISTDEQRRMQFLYLLGIGKFYTYDYANTDGRSSSDAMSSLLSSTLSGQLNDILSQALNMNNWNFSSNLSTGQEGWSDLEVEGILSGRLLDNRLLVNGNFGYRENQLSNNNFVGDFTLQYLLTPSGNIRLKAYNTTNDRYFAKQTFNTQGIGIIYKRDFDSWRKLFRFKRKE